MLVMTFENINNQNVLVHRHESVAVPTDDAVSYLQLKYI